MPLTRADREQVDAYIQNNQPHLARLILEDHLKVEPFDELARKALKKINARYPAASPSIPPSSPPPRASSPKPITAAPEDEITEIKRAIREKRYDDAEALLVLSDHPEAEKIRVRLASIRGGGEKVKRVYHEAQPDFTSKLVLTIVLLFLLFIPGLIAMEIFAAEAKKYPDAPGAQGLILTRKIVWILMILMAVLFGLCMLLTLQTASTVNNINMTIESKYGRR